MNNYFFTEEHNLFRAGLRDFLDREVVPYVDEWEEAGRIPKDLWPKFGEMGYLGLNYPEQYGGIDADFFFSVVFLEETAKCFSGGFTITPSVQQYMASPYIFKHGSEFLKEKYLRRAVSGEWICSIAITEPGAGSDVANIQTRAERRGDHYVVNGSKTFITSGVYGDFLVTVVKTDPEAGINGVSLLVIDRQAPGVSARKLKKLGWHASDTAELSFDDVKVPVENLVGEEGQGFFYLMGGLQLERLAGAVSSVAGAEHALQYALQYMSERQAFGRTINKFQVLRHRVAQLASEIEATKAFVYHCCRLHNDGQYAVKESSMAKLLATELSDKVMYQCLQFFGGYGYMEEYRIARMFRDSRIGTIGGGTSEIMREIIAKMVIDDKQYTGRQADGQTGRQGRSERSDDPVPKGRGGQTGRSERGEDPENRGGQTADSRQADRNGEERTANREPRNTTNSFSNTQNKTTMSFQSTLEDIQQRAARSGALGKTLKFDFGDQKIYLDGSGAANTVSTEDKEADCVVKVTLDDFESILSGGLNPMMAFMSGKIKVQGDMGVAMKLQSLLG